MHLAGVVIDTMNIALLISVLLRSYKLCSWNVQLEKLGRLTVASLAITAICDDYYSYTYINRERAGYIAS